jgi:hypothetical protein
LRPSTFFGGKPFPESVIIAGKIGNFSSDHLHDHLAVRA